ncbi:hypothetical protein ACN26Z_00225 [Verrucosispora sp. WMMD703]|uniref:hypothetical protein n=1 Tax=Verrucosispora sp. WMMD703 TaxID=3403463 RepID=UPI003B93F236
MSTTAQKSAQDIDHQKVRDIVADLASRITDQTVQDSAGAPQVSTYLRQLAALVAIRAAAEELANTAAAEAARCGANYPTIGEAAGMTRQAARVRWPGLVDRSRTVKKPRPLSAEVADPRAANEDE